MTASRHLLSVIILSILSLFLFNSCFPTRSDDNEHIQENTDPEENDVEIDTLPDEYDTIPQFLVSESSIDSLFNVLIKRVESMENVENSDDVFNTDFLSLKKGFATAISKKPSHAKANYGFIISAIGAINTSEKIKKVVDSIQAYIEDVDNYDYLEEPFFYDDLPDRGLAKRKQAGNTPVPVLRKETSKKPLVKNIFDRKGIEGLGYVLWAKSAKIITAQTAKPAFPSFVTVSFIQKAIEEDIIPKLDEIVAACNRLEQNDLSLMVTAFEETFELDLGDILFLEALVRLTRAGLGIFTTYNMDLQSTDGSSIIKLIEEYEDIDEIEVKYNYKLRNDTLFCLRVSNAEKHTSKFADVVQYNLQRSDFLKIRQANHDWVYNDLKKVPELIKASLKAMKEETDRQEDDLVPAGEIFGMNADMADISNEMYEDGISPSLASKFASPEALMDFITEILTKEFTFNERVEGYDVSMTIDLSKWFTNPVSDLKALFPKYRLPQKQDRVTSYAKKYYDNWGGSSIHAHTNDVIDIPPSMIASTTVDSDCMYVRLNTDYTVTMTIDSVIYCTPVFLINDSGNNLPIEKMIDGYDDVEVLRECFPYFNDYTVNGLFPKMTTRTSWIDFISQFYK